MKKLQKNGRIINDFQQRYLEIEQVENKEESGIVEFSLSSETPYRRWFGTEILSHQEEAINLERFNSGSAALLFNHNHENYIGTIRNAWIDNGKLRVTAKFELDNELNPLAKKIHTSVLNGTLKNVSVGYQYDEVEFQDRNGEEYLVVTRWTPHEGSIVPCPADATVGIGRSHPVRSVVADGKYLTEDTLAKQPINVPDNDNSLDKDSLLKQERERSQSLMAAGKKYSCPELAERAVSEGWSLQQFRSEVLDHQKVTDTPVASAIKPVEMSQKERQRYSFNLAAGYAMGWVDEKDVGLELEVSRDIQQRLKIPPKGIYVDPSYLADTPTLAVKNFPGHGRRDTYNTNVPEAAGVLIDTDYLVDRFIDQLVNTSAFLSAGVTYLRNLQGNVEIPREGTYQKGYWVEEAAVIPQEEGTFNRISLTPKKLAVRSKMTYEMATQSNPDLENLTRSRLIRGLGLELDRAIGFGSGIGEEPLGILYHPEVKSIVLGENGGSLDWAALIAMQSEIDSANALSGGNFEYIINSRTKGKLMTTLDQGSGSGNWIWQMNGNGADGTIAGYRARCSNQIPNDLTKGSATDLTAAFFGDFSQVLLGLWTGLDLAADPYTDFDRAIVGLRAIQLVDFTLTRGDYFCVASDIQNN